MPSWIEEQVQKQRFADMVRAVERARLINRMLESKPRRAHFYSPIMAGLGRRLVAWGYILQLRYDPVAEAPIATSAGGKGSPC